MNRPPRSCPLTDENQFVSFTTKKTHINEINQSIKPQRRYYDTLSALGPLFDLLMQYARIEPACKQHYVDGLNGIKLSHKRWCKCIDTLIEVFKMALESAKKGENNSNDNKDRSGNVPARETPSV